MNEINLNIITKRFKYSCYHELQCNNIRGIKIYVCYTIQLCHDCILLFDLCKIKRISWVNWRRYQKNIQLLNMKSTAYKIIWLENIEKYHDLVLKYI